MNNEQLKRKVYKLKHPLEKSNFVSCNLSVSNGANAKFKKHDPFGASEKNTPQQLTETPRDKSIKSHVQCPVKFLVT